jgi:hypothetical protein
LQEFICSCADVVPSDDDSDARRPPNLMALSNTISALIRQSERLVSEQKGSESERGTDETAPTNTNETCEESMMGFSKSARQAPNTLDLASLTRKRKYPSTKFHMMQATSNNNANNYYLNEIIEECEYDSDIGKFLCKNENENYDSEENENSYNVSVDLVNLNKMNDLNSPLKCVNKTVIEAKNITEDQVDCPDNNKIVMKRIEYFESVNVNGATQEKINNTKEFGKSDENVKNDMKKPGDSTMPTVLFSIFILIVALLIVFRRN